MFCVQIYYIASFTGIYVPDNVCPINILVLLAETSRITQIYI